MSDWDAVKQLAAEFQKVQASTGAQKLSERNCVEVVSKLVTMGLLEVLHTVDGKEYLTPQQLEREIRDELAVNKGRLNIVDIQQILNVDLSHIESKVGDILKHDRNIVLLQGELIDKSYMSALCEEVNETLQEVGQVSIADLSRNFSLPNDFLIEHIVGAIGTQIKGQVDKTGSGAIYTDAFVARYKSRIRGLFSGVTRPTVIGPLISQGLFYEKLFISVLHELVSSSVLAGTLHGHLEKAIYVPLVYTRMQNRWADTFLESNGYLEYDALRRLGIENPVSFVAQRYSSRSDVVELSSCVVGDGVMTELAARLEETLHTDGWADVLTLLPTPCTPEDAELLVQKCYSTDPELKAVGGFLVKKTFVQNCFDHFKPLLKEKAQKMIEHDAVMVSEMLQQSQAVEESGGSASGRKRGGRRADKKAGGKKGAQEASKSTVKAELQFMSTEELSASLLEKYLDCSEVVISQIAADISSSLQTAFQEEVRECLSTLGQDSSASQQRKRHADIQEKVVGLWTNAKLFEKAVAHFDGDGAVQVSKYLLRTLCTQITNMVVLYVSDNASSNPDNMTTKERTKLITGLSDRSKTMLNELEQTLSGKETGKFFDTFEQVCMEDFCGILLRKIDKKKERQLLFSHQQSLCESLKEEVEPAMCLHLISVIMFQQHTGTIVHIPGKLVPLVTSYLAKHLEAKTHSKLTECQKMVSDRLRSVGENAGNEGEDDDLLDILISELREIALSKPKKTITTSN